MTENSEAAGHSDDQQPLLQLREIDKHFGPVQALYGVNLDLPAGRVTGLCGDNGAGKSVLTRCIAGVHHPDDGQIFFEGNPVHIRSTRDASALGPVYQDLALADNLDIVQNMFLRRERLRRGLLDEDSMEKQAAETLSTLGVTTVRSIRQRVASLSGGQRQAVAKAVMWNFKLVLLDEPTAALGVVQTRMVLDLVKRLRDRGLAVMVISHSLNDVFEVADRIAVLHLGRMAEGAASGFDRQSVVEYMTTGAAGHHNGGRPSPRGARGDLDAGRHVRAWWQNVRGGDSGVLQVILAIVLVAIVFEIITPEHAFLRPSNLVYIFGLSTVYRLLAMAEIFVLLLGEIDLYTGLVMALSSALVAELVQPSAGLPW